MLARAVRVRLDEFHEPCTKEGPVRNDLIIGFDGSLGAHDALAFARRLALATGGRPRVVCVRSRGPVEPMLDRARELIGDVPGARFDATSGTAAARGLCAAAADAEAALIVLGSTHRSRVGAVMPGTTAEAVIRAAPFAVAIAPAGYAERGPRRPFGLVAVAVDGGAESERVVRIAAGVAEGARADLRLVSVVDGPHADGAFYAGSLDYVAALKARRAAAVAALDRAASVAMSADVEVERRLCDGPLAAEVANESRSADLARDRFARPRVARAVRARSRGGPDPARGDVRGPRGPTARRRTLRPGHLSRSPGAASDDRSQHRRGPRMSGGRLRLVVAGGGVAGLEALVALQALAPGRIDATLLEPGDTFRQRALDVGEPFGMGRARRYPMAELAAGLGATLVAEPLHRVELPERAAITGPAAGSSTTPSCSRWARGRIRRSRRACSSTPSTGPRRSTRSRPSRPATPPSSCRPASAGPFRRTSLRSPSRAWAGRASRSSPPNASHSRPSEAGVGDGARGARRRRRRASRCDAGGRALAHAPRARVGHRARRRPGRPPAALRRPRYPRRAVRPRGGPVLRGVLRTRRGPRYMLAESLHGDVAAKVSRRALWWPPTKVAPSWLMPWLMSRDAHRGTAAVRGDGGRRAA